MCLMNHEDDPAALARALSQNPYITSIRFDLEAVAVTANFDPLLREVARSDILEKVCLPGCTFPGATVRLHSIHARPFLEAFQQNARITTVHLVCLRLTAIDVATLLDNSSSLSTFRLQSCAAESQEAAAAIAAALERNTTIETLELKVLSTPLLVAILERLRHNGSVKKLMYSNYWDILGNHLLWKLC